MDEWGRMARLARLDEALLAAADSVRHQHGPRYVPTCRQLDDDDPHEPDGGGTAGRRSGSGAWAAPGCGRRTGLMNGRFFALFGGVRLFALFAGVFCVMLAVI